MYKYVIARQLATKKLITNKGDNVGRLIDLNVNETTGDIESIIVEVDPSSAFIQKLQVQGNMLEIPYKSVLAVSDVFIVDEAQLLEKK
ncbi:MAG TPA: PRC-barrel domain-containing protein [archaeon]|jgi:sporulation protein YlmC with PRC-barrel domain|nr:PRC-barrel domain-containing protein [archaeon]HRT02471.1 PRC-barrel domain-containing protein [Candidatus Diapherotrites archaeon]